MKISNVGRYKLSICVVAALLAACGGSQPPIGAAGAMPQRSAIVTHAAHGKSWMLPEAASQDLLYVSDTTWVSVYSYPEGKLEGRLHHFYIAQGMCVDKVGDVFVTDLGYNKIFEYAHGGTKRVGVLAGSGRPAGCSVNPNTGDLAATSTTGEPQSVVAVYKRARGKPTIYQDPEFWRSFWCGYDDNGDLFVDGQGYGTGSGGFVFAELPNKGRALKNITLNQAMGFPGGVQWDGRHIAVGSYYPPPSGKPVIYQFAVSGGNGTKVGTTPLRNSMSEVGQFWIQGQTVTAPDGGNGSHHGAALFYKYPAGGKPFKKITKGIVSSQATAVSLAPH